MTAAIDPKYTELIVSGIPLGEPLKIDLKFCKCIINKAVIDPNYNEMIISGIPLGEPLC